MSTETHLLEGRVPQNTFFRGQKRIFSRAKKHLFEGRDAAELRGELAQLVSRDGQLLELRQVRNLLKNAKG